MKPLGIKAKVALATSITSILMIALVTVVQMQRMKADFTKVLFTQQTALLGRTAEELDDKLTMLLDIIALSARHQPVELAGSTERLRTYYQDRAVLALFDDLLVLSPQGVVVADVPVQPGRVGIDASDRAYFKMVMRTRKPLIADPLIGKSNKQPIVQMVAPVLNANGDVVCVLIGVLRLYKDNMLGHLRTAKVGNSGYFFALTRGEHPVYVLHPDASRLLQPRQAGANAATTRALRDGFEGTVDSVNGSGERALNSYKTLKAVDWILAASLPADEAFEPFNGVLSRVLLWSVVASILAAALIGWLTLRLLAPLIKLRDAIVALRGDATHFAPLPVRAGDEVGQLTAAFNNLMRDRLAADARLQSLVEFAPNAIVVVGVDGRIETFNREAERRFGYGRDEILGQPLETLVPAALRAQHAAHRVKFFADRLSAEPVRMGAGATLLGLRRDGSEFPVEINLSAVRTDQGTKVLAVIADITERRRLQLEVEARAQELEQERDRAEAANRAKSEFVANMSHEIRTPMNAVLGMAYLLGNTSLTTQQRKYLNMVKVSGQSLLGILNDVLDFSKIEARHMELSPVEFSLDDTMNSLATMMTMSAGDKELELAISVEPSVPKRLRGDSMRLQQILVNLAGNAIKFTEQGEVVVSVELDARKAHTPHGALLRFEVRDTGIGMTEQQLAQLFHAFSQGDQSITRRFGGTGLGLAITKRLIELMGGQIAVHSTPGQGSTFFFSLPFDVLPERPEERRKPALGDLRLLVADDSRTSRQLIANLIRAWGWQADEVDSGAAALERFRLSVEAERAYDVVLADWHMPGMDGLATAKGIRAAAPDKRQPIVVMVNAFARDRMEEISNAPEADVVLVKPITSSNLFDALHQALVTKADASVQAAADGGIDGSLDGMHFLLVEDNLLNQAVARGILELAGATLDVVDNGQQALERMRASPGVYDLVLMDMQMPVMDGFTATRLLRQELKLDLPIIAMTAGVLESERERSIEAGITDFIPKPIEVEEMLAVLHKHLPGKAAPTGPAAVFAAPAPGPTPAPTPAPALAPAVASAPVAADLPPPPPSPAQAPAPVKLVSSPAPAGEASAFNIDSLMRVMGRDAKGRAVMVKMVRGAIDTGMAPVEQAEQALRDGRPRDAARLFHGLRGAVGVLGARRLIQATIDAETAIGEARDGELAQRVDAVRAELEQTLAEARAWLERQAS
ncbi:PAS domain S-box-containing protein [Duganella sp. CF517]|uniref:response regulator n=1 Tax=Duganella sp. CF517 TaxID=1881038 RepID=UPI0008AD6589|nr:response regulator [Duganella sp. CF517]SEO29974.1 PAS domain S-box-containing protein [Duganella sp. CF517]